MHASIVCAGEKDITGEASFVLGALKDAAMGRWESLTAGRAMTAQVVRRFR
jgi:hypothetical protein